jgi:hypothetical protein
VTGVDVAARRRWPAGNENARPNVFSLRFTDAEAEHVRQDAKALGLSLSGYLRSIVVERPPLTLHGTVATTSGFIVASTTAGVGA